MPPPGSLHAVTGTVQTRNPCSLSCPDPGAYRSERGRESVLLISANEADSERQLLQGRQESNFERRREGPAGRTPGTWRGLGSPRGEPARSKRSFAQTRERDCPAVLATADPQQTPHLTQPAKHGGVFFPSSPFRYSFQRYSFFTPWSMMSQGSGSSFSLVE